MDWREFFQARKEHTVKLLAVDKKNEEPGYPFDDPEYPHAGIIDEKIDSTMRMRWKNSKPEELVSADPLAESGCGWPVVWDAAVGLPASKMRGNTAYLLKNLPVPRHINDTWQNKTMIDLSHIGRVTPESEYRRPKGDWLLDLVLDPKGWKLLELAHMLAHKAEDEELLARRPRPYTYGQNCSMFHLFLFKVFMCRKFGLPIDVQMSGDDPNTNDMFDRYRIMASVGTQLRNPVLKVAANGKACMEPGVPVCVVCGSVHIEPTPHAAATGSDRWLEMNRWSCEPTITTFAGWELVDVVTHAPLLVDGKYSKTKFYALTPPALQESDKFHFYIECAEEKYGKCVADNSRYWLVDDYIDSEDFKKALLESPPLPCKRCFQLNMQSDGSPMKPKVEKPDKPAKKGETPTVAQQEWAEWEAKMEKILGLVETATRFMELREQGALDARRTRKARKHAYSKRVNNLRRAKFLAGRVKKLRDGGYLSKAEELEEEIRKLGDAKGSV